MWTHFRTVVPICWFREKMFVTKDGRVSMIRLDGSEFHDVIPGYSLAESFSVHQMIRRLVMFCLREPSGIHVQRRITALIHMKTGGFLAMFPSEGGMIRLDS